MSGVSIITQLLIANTALTTAVGSRIAAGVLPLNTAVPAISITKVSGVQRKTLAMREANYLETDRVQVTVLDKTYPSLQAILQLVRIACPVSSSTTVAGFPVSSVLREGEGPDFFDDGPGIYSGSIDFMVAYTR